MGWWWEVTGRRAAGPAESGKGGPGGVGARSGFLRYSASLLREKEFLAMSVSSSATASS
jgi:hypothetical protein